MSMNFIYRRIMGLYKADCDRLRILRREHLLTPAQAKDAEASLHSSLSRCLPLFVAHSEHRPIIKRDAKLSNKNAGATLDTYDAEFYGVCREAYPELTPEKADIYYAKNVRCAIPDTTLQLFEESEGCRKSVTIFPAVPKTEYPRMQTREVSEAAIRGVLNAMLELQKMVMEEYGQEK